MNHYKVLHRIIYENVRSFCRLSNGRNLNNKSDAQGGYGARIQYGLWKNSLFLRTNDTILKRPQFNNLCDVVMLGPKTVIDIGYEDKMNLMELKKCLYQIIRCHAANKINKEPFHLYLCKANFEPLSGYLVRYLKLNRNFLQKPHPLIHLTEKSYLDLFPREKLVYLTPHCDETLKTYNHDDIYIIGGIVDESQQGPVSMEVAKEDGLRMARLPLEEHLKGIEDHNLTVDEVMNILLTMKDTMDWKKAFQHVPNWKIQHIYSIPKNSVK